MRDFWYFDDEASCYASIFETSQHEISYRRQSLCNIEAFQLIHNALKKCHFSHRFKFPLNCNLNKAFGDKLKDRIS